MNKNTSQRFYHCFAFFNNTSLLHLWSFRLLIPEYLRILLLHNTACTGDLITRKNSPAEVNHTICIRPLSPQFRPSHRVRRNRPVYVCIYPVVLHTWTLCHLYGNDLHHIAIYFWNDIPRRSFGCDHFLYCNNKWNRHPKICFFL